MAKKKSKLISIRKPRLRISSKGVRLQAPSARIGKKVGLNVSKSGVGASVRTGAGTFNTRRGFSSTLGRKSKKRSGCGKAGCSLLLVALAIIIVLIA